MNIVARQAGVAADKLRARSLAPLVKTRGFGMTHSLNDEKVPAQAELGREPPRGGCGIGRAAPHTKLIRLDPVLVKRLSVSRLPRQPQTADCVDLRSFLGVSPAPLRLERIFLGTDQ